MSPYQTLLVETSEGVTLIRLNRPEALNAFNNQLMDDLTAALAVAEAQKVQDTAKSFQVRRVAEAGAIAGQFQHQIAAWEAAPTVYPQRVYLQTFAKSVGKSRKYIIATTNANEMVQLNLEDKIREDLLSNLEIQPKK